MTSREVSLFKGSLELKQFRERMEKQNGF